MNPGAQGRAGVVDEDHVVGVESGDSGQRVDSESDQNTFNLFALDRTQHFVPQLAVGGMGFELVFLRIHVDYSEIGKIRLS